MDYFELLHKAQTNSKNVSAQDTRCFKTTFSAPKKESKKVSSDNIKRFLARKEEEERQKALEAQKKKEELLALRALDKKSQKRVQVMLKRTKSANKSVMEDAIDNYNTKDTLEGPQQCDEDDYGYVSQEASAFYEKMMAKYEKEPVESQKQMSREVKDLKAAKDRVKAALDKEAEEQMHPTRKRKRKHNDGADDDEGICYDAPHKITEDEKKEEIKEKPKEKKVIKKMPPPVDFFELMKIAAKKQHEPIVIEKKVEEPERLRPMTKKEKIEYEREQERKNRKNNPITQANSKPPEKSSGFKIPRKDEDTKNSEKIERSDLSKPIVNRKNDINSNNIKAPSLKKEIKLEQNDRVSLSSGYREKSRPSLDSKSQKNPLSSTKPYCKEKEVAAVKVDVTDIDKEIELLMQKKQMMLKAAKEKLNKNISSQMDSSHKDINPRVSGSSKNSLINPSNKIDNKIVSHKPGAMDKDKLYSKVNDTLKPGKSRCDQERLTGKTLNERGKPLPKSNETLSSKPSSSGLKPFTPPRYGPPTRLPPHLKKKKIQKRVIDSESEYDSEMDDFIDDGPDESMDYSKHIKEIFGYDKSRYKHIDEEECEESNYRTQMIEEKRSAKIGLLEDLEDIQREKEEKERAKKRKKMMASRR